MIRYNLTICSYCFNVYALVVTNNTLLTNSNVGTTMYTPQSLIPEIAFGTYLQMLDYAIL